LHSFVLYCSFVLSLIWSMNFIIKLMKS
jgi:hypothetical protein